MVEKLNSDAILYFCVTISNSMKNKYKLSLLIAFIQLCFFSKAQVIIAASEISWKCTSNPGVFEVQLDLYTKCKSAASLCPGSCGAACIQTMEIMGEDSGFKNVKYGTINLQLVSVRDANDQSTCASKKSKNACTNMGCVAAGDYFISYELYSFVGLLDFTLLPNIPANSCNIRIAYKNHTRDVTEVYEGSSHPYYTYASINKCKSLNPCNSSPELGWADPVRQYCFDNPLVISAHNIDPDFDSLSFRFAPILIDYETTVTYKLPFGFNRPLPWTGSANAPFPAGISCDKFSGEIICRPSSHLIAFDSLFYGYPVVEATHWKKINNKYEPIGKTRKEMLVVLKKSCQFNSSPRLITNPGVGHKPNKNWVICSKQQFCFTVTAKDTDFFPPLISDTTRISWYGSLAKYGATFKPAYSHSENERKIYGPREDIWKFCWTPDDSLVRPEKYVFTISAREHLCPAGRAEAVFTIKVNQGNGNPLIASAKSSISSLTCGKVKVVIEDSGVVTNITRSLNISVKPNDPNFAFGSSEFTNTKEATVSFTQNGKYFISYIINTTSPSTLGCFPTFTLMDSFEVTNAVNITDSAIVITHASCLNTMDGAFTFYAKGGSPPYQFSMNGQAFSAANLFTNLQGGSYEVIIRDNNNCLSITKSIANIITNGVWLSKIFSTENDTVVRQNKLYIYSAYSNKNNLPINYEVTNGTVIRNFGLNQIEVKWQQRGIGVIMAISVDIDGCRDTSVQKYTIIEPVGLKKLSKLSISVFPNPTSSTVTVQLQQLYDIHYLELYNMQGKLVLKQPLKQSQQLDIADLPTGAYMLKIGDWHGQIIRE